MFVSLYLTFGSPCKPRSLNRSTESLNGNVYGAVNGPNHQDEPLLGEDGVRFLPADVVGRQALPRPWRRSQVGFRLVG